MFNVNNFQYHEQSKNKCLNVVIIMLFYNFLNLKYKEMYKSINEYLSSALYKSIFI